jgi:uncharacterized RDD family membrane protein YckC
MSTTPDPSAPLMGLTTLSFGGYAAQSDAIVGVGFWPRVASRLIDTAVDYGVGYFSGHLFARLVILAAGGHVTHEIALKFNGQSSYVFICAWWGAVAYHTICEGLHGSTLGKFLLSQVVIKEDGSASHLWPAFIRSISYSVDALFFGLIGYYCMEKTVQEQRHGDEWAHTMVCSRSDVPESSRRGHGRFAAALFLGLIANSSLLILGLLMKIIL